MTWRFLKKSFNIVSMKLLLDLFLQYSFRTSKRNLSFAKTLSLLSTFRKVCHSILIALSFDKSDFFPVHIYLPYSPALFMLAINLSVAPQQLSIFVPLTMFYLMINEWGFKAFNEIIFNNKLAIINWIQDHQTKDLERKLECQFTFHRWSSSSLSLCVSLISTIIAFKTGKWSHNQFCIQSSISTIKGQLNQATRFVN